MEFYYRIYGLVVKSEIELPEAYPAAQQNPDVTVCYGIMPERYKKFHEKNYNSSIYLRKYKWLYVEGEGDFLVEDGKVITVEAADTADIRHIRSILLGSCFGSILYQRDIVAIHGASVIWKDRAVIVSGCSGAGKSTVSAALRLEGGLFLADDTVAVTSEDGRIYAYPALPLQKLCPGAAVDFGYDLKELTMLEENYDKYAVNLKDNFCTEKKEVSALICLDIYDSDKVRTKEITGSMKLECILSNLYSYRDYKSASMNTNVFKKCIEIAKKITVIRISRPAGKNAAGEIAEEIIELVDK